ncbi:MAG: 50S ribosomal protein L9 [Saprospiraceae bacterium]|nr:50S ribosomal protein L9 [Saprospiraceae bacterium]
MEIILLKDIDNLGLANTIVKVKPGYARNYLIPQGAAIIANVHNKSILDEKIREQEAKAAEILEAAQAKAATMADKVLKVAAKAGTSGKIFGSVTNVQIAQAIKEQFGIEVERRNVTIPEEVKMLGTYNAVVSLHPMLKANVAFDVYDDNQAQAE